MMANTGERYLALYPQSIGRDRTTRPGRFFGTSPAPELRRMRRSRSRHGEYLLPKGQVSTNSDQPQISVSPSDARSRGCEISARRIQGHTRRGAMAGSARSALADRPTGPRRQASICVSCAGGGIFCCGTGRVSSGDTRSGRNSRLTSEDGSPWRSTRSTRQSSPRRSSQGDGDQARAFGVLANRARGERLLRRAARRRGQRGEPGGLIPMQLDPSGRRSGADLPSGHPGARRLLHQQRPVPRRAARPRRVHLLAHLLRRPARRLRRPPRPGSAPPSPITSTSAAVRPASTWRPATSIRRASSFLRADTT